MKVREKFKMKILFCFMVLVYVFCGPVYGQNAKVNEQDTLEAQKRVLEYIIDPRFKNDTVEREINEYVQNGFAREDFDLDVMREAVAQYYAKELIASSPSGRDSFVNEAKNYGLTYDFISNYIPTREDFEKEAEKAVEKIDLRIPIWFDIPLLSKPFSHQEVLVLMEMFSKADNAEKKKKILCLLKNEWSDFSGKILWEYLISHFDDSLRYDIIDTFNERCQFDMGSIRILLDKARAQGDLKFIDKAFEFIRRDCNDQRQSTEELIREYFKMANPAEMKIILPYLPILNPDWVIDQMITFLGNEEYKECHNEIIRYLSRHYYNIPIRQMNMLADYLVRDPVKNKQLALEFVKFSSYPVEPNNNYENHDKLYGIFDLLSKNFDAEVQVVVSNKLTEFENKEKEKQRRSKEDAIEQIEENLKNYETMLETMGAEERKNAAKQIVDSFEETFPQLFKNYPENEKLESLKKHIEKIKKKYLMPDEQTK